MMDMLWSELNEMGIFNIADLKKYINENPIDIGIFVTEINKCENNKDYCEPQL